MEGEESCQIEGDEAEVGEGGAGGREGTFGCWSEGNEVVERGDGGEFVVLGGVGDGDCGAPEDGGWVGGRGQGESWWWRYGGDRHAYCCVKGDRCVAQRASEGQGSGEGCWGGRGRAGYVEVVEHFWRWWEVTPCVEAIYYSTAMVCVLILLSAQRSVVAVMANDSMLSSI